MHRLGSLYSAEARYGGTSPNSAMMEDASKKEREKKKWIVKKNWEGSSGI